MGPVLLKLVIDELSPLLVGGIISKIHQPDERDIILDIFARGSQMRLLISGHHSLARLHLTGRKFDNPATPLRFCAFLRSRITNARISGVEAEPGQRIARIKLSKRIDDSTEEFTLTAELTGKSANVILTDSRDIILDSLKHFPARTSERAVVPGLKLIPLKPKTTPFEEERIQKTGAETWNAAVDRHYSALLDDELFTLEKSRLRRVISDAAKRLKRKIENLGIDKKHAEANLESEALGRLLTQNLDRIKRGDTEVIALDYTKSPPEETRISLDPKIEPRENLEKFFKRSKKAKASLKLLKERLPETTRELEYIESLEYEWESAKTSEELSALGDELMDEGYLKRPMQAKKKEGPEEERTEPIRRFSSTDGFELLCGKSAAGNDLILKKYASDNDVWFHAQGVAGSHVLIKAAGRGKEITKQTIEEAASLAAWHSKAQAASKTPVVYTEARNVKKPKGAKPGMVTIRDYKTIIVRPRPIEQKT